MKNPLEIRYLKVNRGLKEKRLPLEEAREFETIVTNIYANPSKLDQFIKLFNDHHKVKWMNHVLYYFMKWRLFDSPPVKKSIDISALYMDHSNEILFDSCKKYYDNINGLTNNYFTENNLSADEINLSKIDPILAYTIPQNILGKLDKEENEKLLIFLKEHPDLKKNWQENLKGKAFFVRDGWKRASLARIQGEKKINAYCFDYFNRGSIDDIYILHKELYDEAKKLAA